MLMCRECRGIHASKASALVTGVESVGSGAYTGGYTLILGVVATLSRHSLHSPLPTLSPPADSGSGGYTLSPLPTLATPCTLSTRHSLRAFGLGRIERDSECREWWLHIDSVCRC